MRIGPALLFVLIACGSPRPAPAPTATTTTPTKVTPPPAPPADAAPIIGIALVVTPPDASVMIDDADVGKASALAHVVPITPGLHQIVITAEGYKSYRAELTVSDRTETFTVRLEKKH